MVGYFKLNDPLRIIGLFIILLLIKLPSFLFLDLPTVGEQQYLLLAEKMFSGDFIYQDIETKVGPVTSGIYWLIYTIVGKNLIFYRGFACLLIFFQALFFNFLVDKTEVLKERSYVPAFIYLLFASLYFDQLTLSAELLSVTLLLFAIRELFFMLKYGLNDQGVFIVGFLCGVAAMTDLFSFVYFIVFILSFLLFTGMIFRRYIILIFAFFFPLLVVIAYFYLASSTGAFYKFFFFHGFFSKKNYFINYYEIIILLVPACLLTLMSLATHISGKGFVNYQVRCQQVLILWLFSSIIVALISSEVTSSLTYYFVPGLALFVSSQLIVMKKRLLRELSVFLFVGIMITINMISFKSGKIIDKTSNFPLENKFPEIENQRVMVIGTYPGIYLKNSHTTRFFDWRISKKHFENLNSIKSVTYIFNMLKDDLPDVIVDVENKMPVLMERISLIKSKYIPHKKYKQVYVFKN